MGRKPDDRFAIHPESDEDGCDFPPARAYPADSLSTCYIKLARSVILHAIQVLVRGFAQYDRDDSPDLARAFLLDTNQSGDIYWWCRVARWTAAPIQAWVKRGEFAEVKASVLPIARRDYKSAWAILRDLAPHDMTDWLAAECIDKKHFRACFHHYARDHSMVAKTWFRHGRQWAQMSHPPIELVVVDETVEVKP